jgi:uncharacterized membrane protein YeiH
MHEVLDIPLIEKGTILLPSVFDFLATFIWAVTGALIAARRGYDILGIFIVALVSATGGGLLRDGLFLQNGPPVLVRDSTYLMLIGGGTIFVVFFGRFRHRMKWFSHLVDMVDSIGLAAYAVVGMNLALAAELSLLGVVMVGVVNAVGGGLLRDVLIREEPYIFKPGAPYALLSLIGCGVFLSLVIGLKTGQVEAATATILAVLICRIIAWRTGYRTRPLQAFQDDWEKKD